MVYYCSLNDVGSRLGLNSAQRSSANNKINSGIRRASIDINQEFRDYGRTAPSREQGESTTSAIANVKDTTVSVVNANDFATAGEGNIDGESFSWTGKNGGVSALTIVNAGANYQAGTLSGNPLAMAAGLAMLNALEEDTSVFQRLAEKTLYLENGIRKVLASNDISYINSGDRAEVFGLEVELKKELYNFNGDDAEFEHKLSLKKQAFITVNFGMLYLTMVGQICELKREMVAAMDGLVVVEMFVVQKAKQEMLWHHL